MPDTTPLQRRDLGMLVRETAFAYGIRAADAALLTALLDQVTDSRLQHVLTEIITVLPADTPAPVLDQVAMHVRGRLDRHAESGRRLAPSDAVRLARVGQLRRLWPLPEPAADYLAGVEAVRNALPTPTALPPLAGEERRGALDYAQARAYRFGAEGDPMPADELSAWQQLTELLTGDDRLTTRPPIVARMPVRPLVFTDLEQVLAHLEVGGDYADDDHYADRARRVRSACNWHADPIELTAEGGFLLYRDGPAYYNRPWRVADPGTGLDLSGGRGFDRVEQARDYAQQLAATGPSTGWGRPDLAGRWPQVFAVIATANAADQAYQRQLATQADAERNFSQWQASQAAEHQVLRLIADARRAATAGELEQALAAARQAEQLQPAAAESWAEFRTQLAEQAAQFSGSTSAGQARPVSPVSPSPPADEQPGPTRSVSPDTGDPVAPYRQALAEAGLPTEWQIELRPRRRRLNITIEPDGSVLIAVPPHATPADVVAACRAKRTVVERHVATARARPAAAVKQLVAGEGFVLLGRPHRLNLVDQLDGPQPFRVEGAPSWSHRSWYLTVERAQLSPDTVIAWYRHEGERWIRSAAPSWERRLGLATNPPTYRVADTGTRWGQYEEPSHTITLHWVCLQLPRELVEYVLVHELVHATHPPGAPHGTPWRRRMHTAMPDWEQRKQTIDQTGSGLWFGALAPATDPASPAQPSPSSLSPSSSQETTVNKPAKTVGGLEELRRRLSEPDPALLAGLDDEGVRQHSATLRALADNPTLAVSSSGNLWWAKDGKYWQIGAVGPVRALGPHALTTRKSDLVGLAAYLEAHLVGPDGQFPWRDPDAARLRAIWRSSSGLTFDEAVTGARAAFDRSVGHPTSPAIRSEQSGAELREVQARRHAAARALAERAEAIGYQVGETPQLITGDEIEVSFVVGAGDRARLGNQPASEGEEITITGTLARRPTAQSTTQLVFVTGTGRWRTADGREGPITATRQGHGQGFGPLEEKWPRPHGPVLYRREVFLRDLTLTTDHLDACQGQARALGLGSEFVDAIGLYLQARAEEPERFRTFSPFDELADLAAQFARLESAQLAERAVHIRATGDIATGTRLWDSGTQRGLIGPLVHQLVALVASRQLTGSPSPWEPDEDHVRGWEYARAAATSNPPSRQELAALPDEVFTGARQYTAAALGTVVHHIVRDEAVDAAQETWQQLHDELASADKARQREARRTERRRAQAQQDAALPDRIAALPDPDGYQVGAGQAMQRLLAALAQADADQVAEEWAGVADYLETAEQHGQVEAGRLLQEITALVTEAGHPAPKRAARRLAARLTEAPVDELVHAYQDPGIRDARMWEEIERELHRRGWHIDGRPLAGTPHLLTEAQYPQRRLIGARVAVNGHDGEQIVGVLAQAPSGGWEVTFYEGRSRKKMLVGIEDDDFIGLVPPGDPRLAALPDNELLTAELDARLEALTGRMTALWQDGRRIGDSEFDQLTGQYLTARAERERRGPAEADPPTQAEQLPFGGLDGAEAGVSLVDDPQPAAGQTVRQEEADQASAPDSLDAGPSSTQAGAGPSASASEAPSPGGGAEIPASPPAPGEIVRGRRFGFAWTIDDRRSGVNFRTELEAQQALQRYRDYRADPPQREAVDAPTTSTRSDLVPASSLLQVGDLVDLPRHDIYGGRITRVDVEMRGARITVERSNGTTLTTSVGSALRYSPEQARALREEQLAPVRETERREAEQFRAEREEAARAELADVVWAGDGEVTEGNLRHAAHRLDLAEFADEAVAGLRTAPGLVQVTGSRTLSALGAEDVPHGILAAAVLADGLEVVTLDDRVRAKFGGLLVALDQLIEQHGDPEQATFQGRDLARRLLADDGPELDQVPEPVRQAAVRYLEQAAEAMAQWSSAAAQTRAQHARMAAQRLRTTDNDIAAGGSQATEPAAGPARLPEPGLHTVQAPDGEPASAALPEDSSPIAATPSPAPQGQGADAAQEGPVAPAGNSGDRAPAAPDDQRGVRVMLKQARVGEPVRVRGRDGAGQRCAVQGIFRGYDLRDDQTAVVAVQVFGPGGHPHQVSVIVTSRGTVHEARIERLEGTELGRELISRRRQAKLAAVEQPPEPAPAPATEENRQTDPAALRFTRYGEHGWEVSADGREQPLGWVVQISEGRSRQGRAVKRWRWAREGGAHSGTTFTTRQEAAEALFQKVTGQPPRPATVPEPPQGWHRHGQETLPDLTGHRVMLPRVQRSGALGGWSKPIHVESVRLLDNGPAIVVGRMEGQRRSDEHPIPSWLLDDVLIVDEHPAAPSQNPAAEPEPSQGEHPEHAENVESPEQWTATFRFDVTLHPRDSAGRFIEPGARVRVHDPRGDDAATGVVLGRDQDGRIVVELGEHAQRQVLDRTQLLVTARANGERPLREFRHQLAERPQPLPLIEDAPVPDAPSSPAPADRRRPIHELTPGMIVRLHGNHDDHAYTAVGIVEHPPRQHTEYVGRTPRHVWEVSYITYREASPASPAGFSGRHSDHLTLDAQAHAEILPTDDPAFLDLAHAAARHHDLATLQLVTAAANPSLLGVPAQERIHLLDAQPGDVLQVPTHRGTWSKPIIFAEVRHEGANVRIRGTNAETGKPSTITVPTHRQQGNLRRQVSDERWQALQSQAAGRRGLLLPGTRAEVGETIHYRVWVDELISDSILRGDPSPGPGHAIVLTGIVQDVERWGDGQSVQLHEPRWSGTDGVGGELSVDSLVFTEHDLVICSRPGPAEHARLRAELAERVARQRPAPDPAAERDRAVTRLREQLRAMDDRQQLVVNGHRVRRTFTSPGTAAPGPRWEVAGHAEGGLELEAATAFLMTTPGASPRSHEQTAELASLVDQVLPLHENYRLLPDDLSLDEQALADVAVAETAARTSMQTSSTAPAEADRWAMRLLARSDALATIRGDATPAQLDSEGLGWAAAWHAHADQRPVAPPGELVGGRTVGRRLLSEEAERHLAAASEAERQWAADYAEAYAQTLRDLGPAGDAASPGRWWDAVERTRWWSTATAWRIEHLDIFQIQDRNRELSTWRQERGLTDQQLKTVTSAASKEAMRRMREADLPAGDVRILYGAHPLGYQLVPRRPGVALPAGLDVKIPLLRPDGNLWDGEPVPQPAPAPPPLPDLEAITFRYQPATPRGFTVFAPPDSGPLGIVHKSFNDRWSWEAPDGRTPRSGDHGITGIYLSFRTRKAAAQSLFAHAYLRAARDAQAAAISSVVSGPDEPADLDVTLTEPAAASPSPTPVAVSSAADITTGPTIEPDEGGATLPQLESAAAVRSYWESGGQDDPYLSDAERRAMEHAAHRNVEIRLSASGHLVLARQTTSGPWRVLNLYGQPTGGGEAATLRRAEDLAHRLEHDLSTAEGVRLDWNDRDLDRQLTFVSDRGETYETALERIRREHLAAGDTADQRGQGISHVGDAAAVRGYWAQGGRNEPPINLDPDRWEQHRQNLRWKAEHVESLKLSSGGQFAITRVRKGLPWSICTIEGLAFPPDFSSQQQAAATAASLERELVDAHGVALGWNDPNLDEQINAFRTQAGETFQQVIARVLDGDTASAPRAPAEHLDPEATSTSLAADEPLPDHRSATESAADSTTAIEIPTSTEEVAEPVSDPDAAVAEPDCERVHLSQVQAGDAIRIRVRGREMSEMHIVDTVRIHGDGTAKVRARRPGRKQIRALEIYAGDLGSVLRELSPTRRAELHRQAAELGGANLSTPEAVQPGMMIAYHFRVNRWLAEELTRRHRPVAEGEMMTWWGRVTGPPRPDGDRVVIPVSADSAHWRSSSGHGDRLGVPGDPDLETTAFPVHPQDVIFTQVAEPPSARPPLTPEEINARPVHPAGQVYADELAVGDTVLVRPSHEWGWKERGTRGEVTRTVTGIEPDGTTRVYLTLDDGSRQSLYGAALLDRGLPTAVHREGREVGHWVTHTMIAPGDVIEAPEADATLLDLFTRTAAEVKLSDQVTVRGRIVKGHGSRSHELTETEIIRADGTTLTLTEPVKVWWPDRVIRLHQAPAAPATPAAVEQTPRAASAARGETSRPQRPDRAARRPASLPLTDEEVAAHLHRYNYHWWAHLLQALDSGDPEELRRFGSSVHGLFAPNSMLISHSPTGLKIEQKDPHDPNKPWRRLAVITWSHLADRWIRPGLTPQRQTVIIRAAQLSERHDYDAFELIGQRPVLDAAKSDLATMAEQVRDDILAIALASPAEIQGQADLFDDDSSPGERPASGPVAQIDDEELAAMEQRLDQIEQTLPPTWESTKPVADLRAGDVVGRLRQSGVLVLHEAPRQAGDDVELTGTHLRRDWGRVVAEPRTQVYTPDAEGRLQVVSLPNVPGALDAILATATATASPAVRAEPDQSEVADQIPSGNVITAQWTADAVLESIAFDHDAFGARATALAVHTAPGPDHEPAVAAALHQAEQHLQQAADHEQAFFQALHWLEEAEILAGILTSEQAQQQRLHRQPAQLACEERVTNAAQTLPTAPGAPTNPEPEPAQVLQPEQERQGSPSAPEPAAAPSSLAPPTLQVPDSVNQELTMALDTVPASTSPAPSEPEGQWARRIRIHDEAELTISGTMPDDPPEVRRALRDAKFTWVKATQPRQRGRWTYYGAPAGRQEAIAAIQALVTHLDRAEAEQARAESEAAETAAAAFVPTPQQQKIFEAVATGGDVVVQALAGTGKTTTLRMLARELHDKTILYTAFNKSIVAEARQRKVFGTHVHCSTFHGLAYQALKNHKRYGAKVQKAIKWEGANFPKDIAVELGITQPSYDSSGEQMEPEALAARAMATVKTFRESADEQLDKRHLPAETAADPILAPIILRYAQQAWENICDPAGKVRFTPDDYVKIWALGDPRLPYDVIFFDEAQDISPVMKKIVQSQSAQIVVVGDSQQAIYTFRGAIDALKDWPADHVLPLTQSWRFGPVVAEAGNRVLTLLGSQHLLEGNPALNTQLADVAEPDAVLCRTNAGAVTEVFDALEADRRVALEGGADAIREIAKAAADLQRGKRTKHPELAAFKDWDAVRTYAERDPEARTLLMFVKLVDRFGTNGLISMTKRLVDADETDPERMPQITISTAHKAKGREWARVRIADDFRARPTTDPDTGDEILPHAEEMRLAYVTLTRAKEVLEIGSLSWYLSHEPPSAQPLINPENEVQETTPEATPNADAQPELRSTPYTSEDIQALAERLGLKLRYDGGLPTPTETFTLKSPGQTQGWKGFSWDGTAQQAFTKNGIELKPEEIEPYLQQYAATPNTDPDQLLHQAREHVADRQQPPQEQPTPGPAKASATSDPAQTGPRFKTISQVHKHLSAGGDQPGQADLARQVAIHLRTPSVRLTDDGHFVVGRTPGSAIGWSVWHAGTGQTLANWNGKLDAEAFATALSRIQTDEDTPFDWSAVEAMTSLETDERLSGQVREARQAVGQAARDRAAHAMARPMPPTPDPAPTAAPTPTPTVTAQAGPPSGWPVAITQPGLPTTPPDGQQQCAITVLSTTRKPDDPLTPTEDPDARHLRYRSYCVGCGHEGPIRSRENPAVEDGLNHAFPGWQDMPLLDERPHEVNHTKRVIQRWIDAAHQAYPEGWFERGGPVRTRRQPMGSRHVPGRAPGGGYDVGVVVDPQDAPSADTPVRAARKKASSTNTATTASSQAAPAVQSEAAGQQAGDPPNLPPRFGSIEQAREHLAGGGDSPVWAANARKLAQRKSLTLTADSAFVVGKTKGSWQIWHTGTGLEVVGEMATRRHALDVTTALLAVTDPSGQPVDWSAADLPISKTLQHCGTQIIAVRDGLAPEQQDTLPPARADERTAPTPPAPAATPGSDTREPAGKHVADVSEQATPSRQPADGSDLPPQPREPTTAAAVHPDSSTSDHTTRDTEHTDRPSSEDAPGQPAAPAVAETRIDLADQFPEEAEVGDEMTVVVTEAASALPDLFPQRDDLAESAIEVTGTIVAVVADHDDADDDVIVIGVRSGRWRQLATDPTAPSTPLPGNREGITWLRLPSMASLHLRRQPTPPSSPQLSSPSPASSRPHNHGAAPMLEFDEPGSSETMPKIGFHADGQAPAREPGGTAGRPERGPVAEPPPAHDPGSVVSETNRRLAPTREESTDHLHDQRDGISGPSPEAEVYAEEEWHQPDDGDVILAEDLDAWCDGAARQHRELPGLAAFLDEHYDAVAELFWDESNRQVIALHAQRTLGAVPEYRVGVWPVADFRARFGITSDFAAGYRTIVESGKGAHFDGWDNPELATLRVPAAAFVEEIDRLLEHADTPEQPSISPPLTTPARHEEVADSIHPPHPAPAPTSPASQTPAELEPAPDPDDEDDLTGALFSLQAPLDPLEHSGELDRPIPDPASGPLHSTEPSDPAPLPESLPVEVGQESLTDASPSTAPVAATHAVSGERATPEVDQTRAGEAEEDANAVTIEQPESSPAPDAPEAPDELTETFEGMATAMQERAAVPDAYIESMRLQLALVRHELGLPQQRWEDHLLVWEHLRTQHRAAHEELLRSATRSRTTPADPAQDELRRELGPLGDDAHPLAAAAAPGSSQPAMLAADPDWQRIGRLARLARELGELIIDGVRSFGAQANKEGRSYWAEFAADVRTRGFVRVVTNRMATVIGQMARQVRQRLSRGDTVDAVAVRTAGDLERTARTLAQEAPSRDTATSVSAADRSTSAPAPKPATTRRSSAGGDEVPAQTLRSAGEQGGGRKRQSPTPARPGGTEVVGLTRRELLTHAVRPPAADAAVEEREVEQHRHADRDTLTRSAR